MNDKENQEKSSYEKLRFLATLFVLCLSTMAWAQMKVTGTVVDMMGGTHYWRQCGGKWE